MKTKILKLSAICASLLAMSSINAQTVGFELTPTSGNPTSDIIMSINSSSPVMGVRSTSPSVGNNTIPVKIDVTNTGGLAYGIYKTSTMDNLIISNDIYANASGTAYAVYNSGGYTVMQGNITISAKGTASAYAFSGSSLSLQGTGGTHTIIGGVYSVGMNINTGTYIWDSYDSDILWYIGSSDLIIHSSVTIEFMKALRIANISSPAIRFLGNMSFHTSDISESVLSVNSMHIHSSARFTVILDDGFEAFENDEMSIWSGSSIASGAFDSSNVSIVLSSTGESLTYGDDFTVSATGVVTFLTDVSVVAIPEPSTYAMIFGVLALGLAIYRRRK